MPIKKELLDILCCPKCKGDIDVEQRGGRSGLPRLQAPLPHKG